MKGSLNVLFQNSTELEILSSFWLVDYADFGINNVIHCFVFLVAKIQEFFILSNNYFEKIWTIA